jgi:hypothetical protein
VKLSEFIEYLQEIERNFKDSDSWVAVQDPYDWTRFKEPLIAVIGNKIHVLAGDGPAIPEET